MPVWLSNKLKAFGSIWLSYKPACLDLSRYGRSRIWPNNMSKRFKATWIIWAGCNSLLNLRLHDLGIVVNRRISDLLLKSRSFFRIKLFEAKHDFGNFVVVANRFVDIKLHHKSINLSQPMSNVVKLKSTLVKQQANRAADIKLHHKSINLLLLQPMSNVVKLKPTLVKQQSNRAADILVVGKRVIYPELMVASSVLNVATISKAQLL